MSEIRQPIIQVRNLGVNIKMDEGLLTPVRGVDFEIHPGETLGLVGESGCGKSLTSKAILAINDKKCRSTGEILFRTKDGDVVDILALDRVGRHMPLMPWQIGARLEERVHDIARFEVARGLGEPIRPIPARKKEAIRQLRAIRGKQISMIFQEPMVSFSPMYTIGSQINECTRLHITKDKVESKRISLEMMKMVGIANAEKRYDQYPHEFSGGMLQRALIAMALVCKPRLLIADEPTTALDVTIQAQILELMQSLQKELGMAILFITHDLGTVAKMCDRVAVMYLGKIVETGTAREIYKNPQHPYTKGLMGSVHKIGTLKQDRLFSIEGTVPLALSLGPGCGFYDRCTERIEGLCDKVDPTLSVCDGSHCVACHRCNPDVQAPSTAEPFVMADKTPEPAETMTESIAPAPEALKADEFEAKAPHFDEPDIADSTADAIPAEAVADAITTEAAVKETPAVEASAADAAQAAIDAAAARKQAYVNRYKRIGLTKGGRR